jgi:hypothetical protein
MMVGGLLKAIHDSPNHKNYDWLDESPVMNNSKQVLV